MGERKEWRNLSPAPTISCPIRLSVRCPRAGSGETELPKKAVCLKSNVLVGVYTGVENEKAEWHAMRKTEKEAD